MKDFRPAKKRVEVSVAESVRILREGARPGHCADTVATGDEVIQ